MERKPIAVLGGGNGAHALAADLTNRGFRVNLYEMPQFKNKMKKVFETRKVESVGAIKGIFELEMVTDQIEEAIADVKYIVILTPAFAHKDYGRLLKGKVRSDQVIVCIPGAFASLKLRKIFGSADGPVLVDANNLMYDVRLVEDGKVNITELDQIDVAFLPANRSEELIGELKEMFDIDHVFQDVLECGLALVNPALHSGPCLLNAGPIESPHQNFFLYEHGLTPSAMKLDKRIDEERKAIAAKLGYAVNPFRCFPNIRAIEKEGKDYTWQDLYRAAHGDIGLTPICGPNDIKSRYLTEDAPCGLVPWAHIGKALGVDTTAIDSIINLYSVFHETNWWEEGVSLEDLGLDGMNAQEMKEYCKTGSGKDE